MLITLRDPTQSFVASWTRPQDVLFETLRSASYFSRNCFSSLARSHHCNACQWSWCHKITVNGEELNVNLSVFIFQLLSFFSLSCDLLFLPVCETGMFLSPHLMPPCLLRQSTHPILRNLFPVVTSALRKKISSSVRAATRFLVFGK